MTCRRFAADAYRVTMAHCAQLIEDAGRALTSADLAPAFAGLSPKSATTRLGKLVSWGWLQRERTRLRDATPRYLVGDAWSAGGAMRSQRLRDRDPLQHALRLLGVALAVEVHHRHVGRRVQRDVRRIAGGARELAGEALLEAIERPGFLSFRFEPRHVAAGGAA